jgi:hypothetical protein
LLKAKAELQPQKTHVHLNDLLQGKDGLEHGVGWGGGVWGPRGAGGARPDFEQKIEIVSKRGNPWVRARRAESGRSQVSTPWRQGNSLI